MLKCENPLRPRINYPHSAYIHNYQNMHWGNYLMLFVRTGTKHWMKLAHQTPITLKETFRGWNWDLRAIKGVFIKDQVVFTQVRASEWGGTSRVHSQWHGTWWEWVPCSANISCIIPEQHQGNLAPLGTGWTQIVTSRPSGGLFIDGGLMEADAEQGLIEDTGSKCASPRIARKR